MINFKTAALCSVLAIGGLNMIGCDDMMHKNDNMGSGSMSNGMGNGSMSSGSMSNGMGTMSGGMGTMSGGMNGGTMSGGGTMNGGTK